MPTRSSDPDPPGARLAAELAGLEHALPGSLLHRWMRCGKTNCRCKADPPTLHGPYVQWTRTVAGRTVTKILNAEQASRYQPWFDNARRLRQLITDLEARSLRALEQAEGSDLRNRLTDMSVAWHFRNRRVPESDEVRKRLTPQRASRSPTPPDQSSAPSTRG